MFNNCSYYIVLSIKKRIQIPFCHIMFKFILYLMLPLCSFSLSAQVSSTSRHIVLDNEKGVDKVFIFQKIDDQTEIKYSGTGNSVRWLTYADGVLTEVSNLSYLYPENNKGYALEVDGKMTYYWVYDYTAYVPVLTSLEVSDGDAPCESVELTLTADIPPLVYQHPQGGRFAIDRTFDVSYRTLAWADGEWKEEEKTSAIQIDSKTITLPVPLTTTTFTLSGDAFANALGLSPVSVVSSSYFSSAVKTHITTTTTTREALNENKRPEQAKQLDGSAPLEIEFVANPTPNATNYLWEIYKNNELLLTRTEPTHRYRFDESGNYRIKLEVSTQHCLDTASVDVIVSESQLYAPPVFTPNGDGKNDEFRVAYQSITEFLAIIYNRWGRVLYRWDNPQQGWDGTIDGKPAAEGTYFYVIKAKGSDEKQYELKGHVTLLR